MKKWKQNLIQELTKHDIRAAAWIANLNLPPLAQSKMNDSTRPSIALKYWFQWDATPQGYIYWDDMIKKIIHSEKDN